MARIVVVTGAPCTGKSTVLNELEKRGYKILGECVEESKKALSTNSEMHAGFEDMIFKLRFEQTLAVKDKAGIIFSDRGLGDNLAYCKLRNSGDFEPMLEKIKEIKYEKVFLFEPLGFYEAGEQRQLPESEQGKIHELLIEVYKELGYDIISVPKMSVEERVDFILERI